MEIFSEGLLSLILIIDYYNWFTAFGRGIGAVIIPYGVFRTFIHPCLKFLFTEYWIHNNAFWPLFLDFAELKQMHVARRYSIDWSIIVGLILAGITFTPTIFFLNLIPDL